MLRIVRKAAAIAAFFVALLLALSLGQELLRPGIGAWRYLIPWIGEVGSIAVAALTVLSLLLAARLRRGGVPSWRVLVAALIVCGALWPLFLFERLRRHDAAPGADCVLVFGARVYSDDRLSTALYDRIRTSTEYAQASGARLILSGGPGDGRYSEAQAMAEYARGRGIPGDRLVLDEDGLSTRHTLRNARRIAEAERCHRIVAVSQFYHLPRIAIEAARLGLPIELQHARPSLPIRKLPLLMARESPAFWLYWLQLWQRE